MKYQYPVCPTVDKVEDWFGTSLPDPYAWLRNAKDPEVLDFVARENAFTDSYFASRPLEEKIDRLKADKLPGLPRELVPWKDGYLACLTEDGNYKIRVLNRSFEDADGLPQVHALDGLVVFSAYPCPCNDSLLALMVQHPGAARPSVALCDMDRRILLHEVHEVFSFCWSKGDGCLYYSSTLANSETQQSHSVFYRFDPKSVKESVVYEDDSYAIFGQVASSRDGAWIMAMVCQDYALARWVAIDTASGRAEVLNDHPVEWKYLDSLNGEHYFITVSEADRGAVIRVSGARAPETVMPESELILDSGFSVGGKLYLLACRDVSSRLVCLETGEEVPLPDPYGALALVGHGENEVFLRFESFLIPPSILRFDGGTMETVMRGCQDTYPDQVAEQHFAPSAGDGTPIPYYIVRKKDARPDGKTPVLMYAYGGYNISMPPSYQEMVTQIVVPRWVERGGIYVHCNLRGGNEYGPKWHEAGMAGNKRHCYEDFIGVAEQIIRDGWTCAGKIGIAGCSNGGLLMSALVTMRPDLWGCVIDSVPHTDMIHFAEDDRGPMYITEYGNPRESREMFEYLLSYSPYHNVRKTDYPPTYIQTGELDNNVPPYHGKKFAARMQAENQSGNPILLRVLAEGSHDRGKGEVFWRTIAEMQLFLDEHLKEC